jgi:hypothetical protein
MEHEARTLKVMELYKAEIKDNLFQVSDKLIDKSDEVILIFKEADSSQSEIL